MSMQLAPEPNYYLSSNDKSILQYMDSVYADASNINQSFWVEADLDSRFRAGDKNLWNDIYGNISGFRRKSFNFNRIRRVCNMVSGYQREHRKSTLCVPIEGSDQQTCDDFTDLFFHLNTNSSLNFNISEAFDNALTTGLSFIHPWIDYRNDPVSGDIKIDWLPYNEFLVDPYFRKKDLSDCNYLWRRKWLTKQQATALYPEATDLIKKVSPRGNKDGKFQYQPESYDYGSKGLIAVDEFWYRSSRKKKMLIDTESGESIEWGNSGTPEALKEFQRDYPQVLVIDQDAPTVKLAIAIERSVIYNGPNPMGIDEYPFVPVWAYYEPHLSYFPSRIQGMVRGLRDSQYLYDRRKVIELDILESQVTSGYYYKENALVNPDDVFLADQGKGIAIKAEASLDDVRKIEPAVIPPNVVELSKILGQEIQEISGVNEELLGSASDDKAGILSMLRQGAGLTTLRILFDQLDESQKMTGRLIMKMMQENYSYGKVKRILGREPSPQFYNRAFQKYDCAVAEGADTDTQKQLEFAQLLHLKEAGVPVTGEDLAEASTLHNKDEMSKKWAQREQEANQQAQMQQEAQIAVLQGQIKDLNARATANEGLGIERVSRVEENRALAIERVAEAKKDKMAGMLDLVKTIKELQQIDLGQIENMLAIADQLEGRQEEKEESEATASPTV